MNANELMIGDWVEFTSKYDCGTGQIAAIEPMEGTADPTTFSIIKNKQDGSHFYVGVSKNGVRPIPITAEILEKNGWKLLFNTGHKLEYSWSTGAIEEYADIHIYVGKDRNNVWRWDFPILNIHLYRGDMELTKFRYVHELQHVLRLCGIEKEIVL